MHIFRTVSPTVLHPSQTCYFHILVLLICSFFVSSDNIIQLFHLFSWFDGDHVMIYKDFQFNQHILVGDQIDRGVQLTL